MTDAFERFSHRALSTKRGRRSEVRPSAAPRSESRNHASVRVREGAASDFCREGLQDFSFAKQGKNV